MSREFMPPRSPWDDGKPMATNERDSWAEQYVGALVDRWREARGRDSDGLLHTLKGFVANDPEFLKRVAGDRDFERIKAAIAGNGTSRNESTTSKRGVTTMTQYKPVQNAFDPDAEPGEPVEAPASNEETRYMPTLEDRQKEDNGDSGERQFMPPLEDRR